MAPFRIPNVPPTHAEMKRIETAWQCLEAITEAMSGEQELELLTVMTLCWQDISEWSDSEYSTAVAECHAMAGIRKGIEKKLLVGAENDTFEFIDYADDKNKGVRAAYVLGQKLVRWNKRMEDRFFDRMLRRRGPLQPDKMMPILNWANNAYLSWCARAESAG